eukprot:jgi/Hompol1/6188/HPOL_004098-RA
MRSQVFRLHAPALARCAAAPTSAQASLLLPAAASPCTLSSSLAALSLSPTAALQKRSFASTPTALGLEEFFENGRGWIWNEKEQPHGRAWQSAELRNKSFDDMHKLWWVCIKEQNKLCSQQEEARRFNMFFPHKERLRELRLTMARIKQVIWERREAWMQAQAVLKQETARAELAAAGLEASEIDKRIAEMFPVPLLLAGKAAERKRWTYETSRTQKYWSKRGMNKLRKIKPSAWTVV